MYIFESNHKNKDIVTLFCNDNNPNTHAISDKMAEDFQVFHRPDVLLLLYPDFLDDYIQSSNFSPVIDQLERFGDSVTIYLASFNSSGKVEYRIHHEGTKKLSLDTAAKRESLRQDIVTSGLLKMANKNQDNIILSAPTGTIFCKPSGELYSEFIKASELASTNHEIKFIAFSLLEHIGSVENLHTVYIDTMSISSYAECLISFISKFNDKKDSSISYQSFNSYEGLPNYKPEDPEGVFVIISASSSNKMSQKIKSEWALQPNQIINFLSYKDSEENGASTILNIKSLSKNPKLPGTFEKKLRIIGENFAVEASTPTSVLINSINPPRTIEKNIFKKHDTETYQCNKTPYPGKSDKHICINWLSAKPEVIAWLTRTIHWHAPANTATIVYNAKNPLLGYLLNHTKETLSEITGKTIETYSYDEIGNINPNDSVILLSDAISTGRIFVSANRELRRAGHTANRIFISPFATFETEKKFKSLKNTIEKGDPGFSYKLLTMETLFIGPHSLSEIWDEELSLVSTMKSTHWKNRSYFLSEKSKGTRNGIGSYTTATIGDEFNKDFAYWPSDYEKEKTTSAAVYATIASILQSLRDLDSNEKNSLTSSPYTARILSPENFWRFNDALIQSCLWRAALHSELDYRGSSDASRMFSDLVIKYLHECATKKSNVVFDYLIAVAIGKIKISQKCAELITEKAKELLPRTNPAIEVVEQIVRIYNK